MLQGEGVSWAEELGEAGVIAASTLLFVLGYRDPLIPSISSDYVDIVEGFRREIEIGDEAWSRLLEHKVGLEPGLPLSFLSGDAFLSIVHTLAGFGFDLARLERTVMTRWSCGVIHRARAAVGSDGLSHEDVLVEYGGGVLHTRNLDELGFLRVLAYYQARGFVMPEEPCFGDRPGMASPAQVNLIRGLWRRHSATGDAASLDEWLGCAYGFAGLEHVTRAGARLVIDRLAALPAAMACCQDLARDATA